MNINNSVVIKHLCLAVEQEIRRLEAVHALAGDAWPDDFDPNDIPLLKMMLEELRGAAKTGVYEVPLHFKGFAFVVDLLPSYIERNKMLLSDETCLVLTDSVERFEASTRRIIKAQGNTSTSSAHRALGKRKKTT